MNKEEFIRQLTREQEPLRRFLRILCRGDSFRADDIAQEAMLKAYLSFERFEGRAKFSTWLFKIAYNCFYSTKTAETRRIAEPLCVEAEIKAGEQTDSDGRFEHQRLYLAIDSLTRQEQAVILLFYMEEKSIKEIAEITGMPSGTVRSHLSRGRAHLKRYLANEAI